MLPDNFDFAQLPDDRDNFTLEEVGMLSSRIEDIDYAITSWLKEDLDLSTITNEGNKRVPVLWQTPERAFQIKSDHDLRHPVDDGDGVITLPVITIERTAITKDPTRKADTKLTFILINVMEEQAELQLPKESSKIKLETLL